MDIKLTNSPLTRAEITVALLLFVSTLGLHLSFTPWLFASHPINEIQHYNVENVPPPDHARSFAINHGRAIYYNDDVPRVHPVKRIVILAAALGMWVALVGIAFRARQRARATAAE